MALPIEHLQVIGYRGLRDVVIKRPSRVNLLVGPNNAGKTSVLEALALFAHPLDPGDWMSVVRSRAPQGTRKELVDGLRWLFPRPSSEPNRPPTLQIAGTGRHKALEVMATLEEREQESVQSEDESEPEVGAERDSGVRLTLHATLDNEANTTVPEESELYTGSTATFWEQHPWGRPRTPSTISLPCQLVAPYSHRIERLQVGNLSTVLAAEGRDAIVEVLQQFDPDVTGIELLDPTGRSSDIYLKHTRLGLPPLASFGDGMRRIAALVLATVAARGGLLLIDEIEASLHTHMLTKVFDRLAALATAHDVQVFATTHSLEAVDAVVDAFPEADVESLAAYHLAREGGAINARRYASSELRYLRHERALDIR